VILHAPQLFFVQKLVDYAGLFPPAALELGPSLEAYRRYQQSAGSFLLGRFICPARSLGDLAQLVNDQDAFLLSALLDAPEELDALHDFHEQVSSKVRVDTVETRWIGAEQGQRWLRRWNYSLFFEVAPEQAHQAGALAQTSGGRVGLKLRTGSVKAEGFPSYEAIGKFLYAAHQVKVPYKFTAGLHHARNGVYPLTYEPDSGHAPMLGFVTIFGVACLHASGQISEAEIAEALNDGAIEVDGLGLHWRDRTCNLAQIQEFRTQAGRSFGSCSFEEPYQELTEIGWIC